MQSNITSVRAAQLAEEKNEKWRIACDPTQVLITLMAGLSPYTLYNEYIIGTDFNVQEHQIISSYRK